MNQRFWDLLFNTTILKSWSILQKITRTCYTSSTWGLCFTFRPRSYIKRQSLRGTSLGTEHIHAYWDRYQTWLSSSTSSLTVTRWAIKIWKQPTRIFPKTLLAHLQRMWQSWRSAWSKMMKWTTLIPGCRSMVQRERWECSGGRVTRNRYLTWSTEIQLLSLN